MSTQTKIDQFFPRQNASTHRSTMDSFHDRYISLLTGPRSPLGVLACLNADVRYQIYKSYFHKPISTIELRFESYESEEELEDEPDELTSSEDEDGVPCQRIKRKAIQPIWTKFGALSLTSRRVNSESYTYRFARHLTFNHFPDPCLRDPKAPYRLSTFLRSRITHLVFIETVDETKALNCSKFPNLESVEIQATFSEDDEPYVSRWDVHREGTAAEFDSISKDMREMMYHFGYKLPLKNYKETLKIEAMGFRCESERERDLDDEGGHEPFERSHGEEWWLYEK